MNNNSPFQNTDQVIHTNSDIEGLYKTRILNRRSYFTFAIAIIIIIPSVIYLFISSDCSPPCSTDGKGEVKIALISLISTIVGGYINSLSNIKFGK